MARIAPAAVLAALLLHAPSASPCGALFRSESDQNLALDAQRALIVLRANTVDLHLQLRAVTGGAPFAWIVPVPGTPTLSLGDGALFDALDQLTTPSVEIVDADSGGGGGLCAGDALKGDGGFRSDQITHFGGGTLGDYTYDIIAGNTAEAIEGWLSEHSYTLSAGFAAAVAPYAGHASFVAVRLSPGASSETDLTPLVVSFPRPFESSLTYPLGFSRLSTTSVAPVVLWVLAAKRHRIANFASAELSLVADVMREQADRHELVSYADAITALTHEAGGRLAITEYARELADEDSVAASLHALVDADAHYLTRLYMEVAVDDIEDLVVTFAANAPDVAPFATAEAAHRTPVTAACIALAVLVLALRRRAPRPEPSVS